MFTLQIDIMKRKCSSVLHNTISHVEIDERTAMDRWDTEPCSELPKVYDCRRTCNYKSLMSERDFSKDVRNWGGLNLVKGFLSAIVENSCADS